MSLKTIYERFLSSPNPLSLSETATLHYVTTLKSFNQQGPIVRHLENQNKNVVKKKAEKIMTTVEGHSSIALEVDTTVEFVSSGGAYLPGLDNFIVDRIATFPITHIVQFDKDQKISQIRLSWDQGSLLKQVEVIGKSGRGWPIMDGQDQIKVITRSSDSAAAVAPSLPPSRGRTDQYSEGSQRNASPSKKFIKDPHASLDLFEGPVEDENKRPTTSESNSIAPRETARPPAREYSEIFAAGHEDFAPSPNGSPSKAYAENVVAPKGAGARRFQTSRLFEEDQDYKERKIYKTNPARYNHFDIGDHQADDPMQHNSGVRKEQKNVPLVARSKKNESQWNFEDFSTQTKPGQRQREQDKVNFSFEDQEGKPAKAAQQSKGRQETMSHFDFQDDGTPVQRMPANPKARKDAELHFEFRDDASPAPRRIIARTKAAQGLYANPLDDDEQSDGEKAPLKPISTNAGRRKDFESHWDTNEVSDPEANGHKKNVGENRQKAIKSMGSKWDDYESPEVVKKPNNKARHGMTSTWDF